VGRHGRHPGHQPIPSAQRLPSHATCSCADLRRQAHTRCVPTAPERHGKPPALHARLRPSSAGGSAAGGAGRRRWAYSRSAPSSRRSARPAASGRAAPMRGAADVARAGTGQHQRDPVCDCCPLPRTHPTHPKPPVALFRPSGRTTREAGVRESDPEIHAERLQSFLAHAARPARACGWATAAAGCEPVLPSLQREPFPPNGVAKMTFGPAVSPGIASHAGPLRNSV
jgi:hypothetical protein